MYSGRTYPMISCSNSPLDGKSRGVQSFNRPLFATTGALGLPRMRTALPDMLIIFPRAQHPIQPHRQLVGNRHLGYAVMLGHRQAQILPMPARIIPLRRACRLHQQKGDLLKPRMKITAIIIMFGSFPPELRGRLAAPRRKHLPHEVGDRAGLSCQTLGLETQHQ